MNDSASRWVLLGSVSVIVWIVVYWWWEPGSVSAVPDVGDAVARGNASGDDPARLTTPGPESAATGVPASESESPSPPPRVIEPPVDPIDTAGERGADEPGEGAWIRPRFREYVVQRGDTLGRIAARELGSARLVEVIQRANPFKDPERLRPGDVIRIPVDPGNIQGVPADGEPPDAPAIEFTEYRVVSGDTLSGIAQKVWGQSSAWRTIYEANRDQLRSPDAVRVGQTLRIPPQPDDG